MPEAISKEATTDLSCRVHSFDIRFFQLGTTCVVYFELYTSRKFFNSYKRDWNMSELAKVNLDDDFFAFFGGDWNSP